MTPFAIHNQFRHSIKDFSEKDPHLNALSQLKYQYSPKWWYALKPGVPGIYILTGGRQIGKSTSCKLLIKYCLEKKLFEKNCMFYLPCDEIFDAKNLSLQIRNFLDTTKTKKFLLIVDEITYVKHWERVIKALADEGWFTKGICLLTGSDTLILKEAAMSFPGRRGRANQTDFHLFPLTFREYVELIHQKKAISEELLKAAFDRYLKCGGYLRAINDLATHNEIQTATYQTYEQWIRGDFLKQGKNEAYLLAVLAALFKTGGSHISYSSLTQNIGMISKETVINYCDLLERMDILFALQAFDQNKKQGFPRKGRKFHFLDPFIQNTLYLWLQREGLLSHIDYQAGLVEAIVASHCRRLGKTFYFKGQGEVDVIWLDSRDIKAIEVKWTNQMRPNDLKMLKQFKNSFIVGKQSVSGTVDGITSVPVYKFLYEINNL